MLKIDNNISTFLIAIAITGGMLSTTIRGPNNQAGGNEYAFMTSANGL